ncbi:MAG: UDP-N-acetylglucosamine--N-acetylmuramyl-(pentapeptide) pyrophosphoryl-undecaprenol N-acetylglucosamine transferase [Chloroflexi bacterium]|nr:UDP-N-acetylglucosamine--N-acetylmuramyl-(pentapeptide) pyrophosphoryl-undecaprenol N-acetylglucosamine transferase [Chloroflexota bacterium]
MNDVRGESKIQTPLRLILTGGGTGGHIYPALAVACAWQNIGISPNGQSILFVGSSNELERTIVKERGLKFTAVQTGPLRGKGLHSMVNLGRVTWGIGQALGVTRRFKPHVILATGGYVCAPIILAGWMSRIPIVIYLPDIRPGWTVRLLSTLATRIAVTAEESRYFLPSGRVVVTGYPTRPTLKKMDRFDCLTSLGLDAHLPTVLVLGGTRGARSINQAIGESLRPLLEISQIIHVCGRVDEAWLSDLRNALPNGLQERYLLHRYLSKEFPHALAAADLAVSRSGASVLGEFPVMGLPSILVPYPYAGGHQQYNADYLAGRGAAIKIEDSQLNGLFPTISQLLTHRERLMEMRHSADALARPQAAANIAGVLAEIGTRD